MGKLAIGADLPIFSLFNGFTSNMALLEKRAEQKWGGNPR